MKAVLALCFLAVANAAVIPLNYNTGHAYSYGVLPYTGAHLPYTGGVLPYTGGVLPYTGGFVPQTFGAQTFGAQTYGVLPTAYVSAPVQYKAVQTSVVAPGYVAKTPGAEHIAPLPAGLGYASHHINLAKAPGTA